MRDTFIQARLNGITPPDREAMEAARPPGTPSPSLSTAWAGWRTCWSEWSGRPAAGPAPWAGRRWRCSAPTTGWWPRGSPRPARRSPGQWPRHGGAALLRVPHGPDGRGPGVPGGLGMARRDTSPGVRARRGAGGGDPEHDQGPGYGRGSAGAAPCGRGCSRPGAGGPDGIPSWPPERWALATPPPQRWWPRPSGPLPPGDGGPRGRPVRRGAGTQAPGGGAGPGGQPARPRRSGGRSL